MKSFIVGLTIVCFAIALPQLRKEERSDDENELLEGKVLETGEGFEVREYPKSVWICTRGEVNPAEDPMNGWEEKFPTPLEAMSASTDRSSDFPRRKMFRRLFRYIVGVNEDHAEIEMTRPVTTKRIPQEGSEVEQQEMCFWTGSPWAGKQPPEPLDPEVYVQRRPRMVVYVRQFSGWAISENNWREHNVELRKSLEGREDVQSNEFYSASYNSPWASEGRRNEIWVERVDPEDARDGENDEESQREQVPFEIVEEFGDVQVRKYRPSKWVCAQVQDYDINNDPLKGWQDRYESAEEAKKDKKKHWKDSPLYDLKRQLKLYFYGVNADVVEINKTSPYTTRHVIKPNNLEDIEKCIWTGSAWEDKILPEPLKKDAVYIQNRPELVVYTRTFTDPALSFADWTRERQTLVEAVGDREYNKDVYYTVKDGNWRSEDRKYEVWLLKSQADEVKEA